MFCSKCGQSIADGSKFCPYCGAARTPAAAPAAPAQPAPPQAPAQAPSQTPAQGYGYVPQQQPAAPGSAYQQPAYPGGQGYAYPPQTGYPAPAKPAGNKAKWPVIIPILLLLGIAMLAVLIVLNFDYIVDDFSTILLYFGTGFFAIVSMFVFFARTRLTPVISAVFHTLLFLIPVGLFAYVWIDRGGTFDWKIYVRYGSLLMMIVFYLIGAGIGKRNVGVALLYMLFAIAFCVMACWNIISLFDYVDYLATEVFISSLFDMLYMVPICLGFIIALFSLPSRRAI